MFKEDTFSFTPTDDLVLSMPFEFIRNLKVGIWTNIERNWLKRLQKHFAQAENNSIEQVRFIRKIVTDNRMKESREYEDDHEKNIFKIYTTKGDNYFVNLAQIHDIIGDEPWFNGETKCLGNIASNRMIWEIAILFCWQFVLLFVLPALVSFCQFVWGQNNLANESIIFMPFIFVNELVNSWSYKNFFVFIHEWFYFLFYRLKKQHNPLHSFLISLFHDSPGRCNCVANRQNHPH